MENNEHIDFHKRSLTANEIMELMNNQIQSIRSEFMGAIQDISKKISSNHDSNTMQIKQQFESVRQIKRATDDNYYHPEPVFNNIEEDKNSTTADFIDFDKHYPVAQPLLPNKSDRRKTDIYHAYEHDNKNSEYTTNDSSRRMQQFTKSASENNIFK